MLEHKEICELWISTDGDTVEFAHAVGRAVLAKAMQNEALLNSLLECVKVPEGATIYDKFNALQQHWYVTARDSLAMPMPKQEPVFYYRPTSSGGYEGPIWAGSIEKCRIDSGVWKPLYADPQPAQAAAIPDQWREIVADLANDLECEILAKYTAGMLEYPSQKRSFDADMDVIIRAKAMLSASPKP